MTASRLVVVDLSEAETPIQLQDVLAAGFAFPDWYGRNWDAFYDSVTTLDPMPKKIVVRGLKALSKRLPGDAERLTDILEDFRAAPDLVHVEMILE
ncbi:MAG TPA: barstar family protein [Opitutaceae bacterium]|nr:barstar family protein [Opitutaceae bacterium]HRE84541.1 barstar family protein [Opitutaceae bacterium]